MQSKLPQDAIKILTKAKTHLAENHDVQFDINDIDAAIKLKTLSSELGDDELKGLYATFIREMQNIMEHDEEEEQVFIELPSEPSEEDPLSELTVEI